MEQKKFQEIPPTGIEIDRKWKESEEDISTEEISVAFTQMEDSRDKILDYCKKIEDVSFSYDKNSYDENLDQMQTFGEEIKGELKKIGGALGTIGNALGNIGSAVYKEMSTKLSEALENFNDFRNSEECRETLHKWADSLMVGRDELKGGNRELDELLNRSEIIFKPLIDNMCLEPAKD